jgi:hypothetical protein
MHECSLSSSHRIIGRELLIEPRFVFWRFKPVGNEWVRFTPMWSFRFDLDIDDLSLKKKSKKSMLMFKNWSENTLNLFTIPQWDSPNPATKIRVCDLEVSCINNGVVAYNSWRRVSWALRVAMKPEANNTLHVSQMHAPWGHKFRTSYTTDMETTILYSIKYTPTSTLNSWDVNLAPLLGGFLL